MELPANGFKRQGALLLLQSRHNHCNKADVQVALEHECGILHILPITLCGCGCKTVKAK